LRLASCLSALLLIAVGQTAMPPVVHIRLAPDEQFLLCVQTVFNKPAFRAYDMPWPEGIRCPQDRQLLLGALQGKGYSAFESINALYVVPTLALGRQPGEDAATWKRVAINMMIEPSDDQHGRVSGALEAEVLKAVRAAVRMVPLNLSRHPDRGTDAVSATLRLLVREVELGTRRRSIVAILGGAGPARLIYGDVADRRYRARWDSPLLSDWGSLGLDYTDLDGDGVKEILVWSSRPPYYRLLTAFTVSGRELIHASGCIGDGLQGFDEMHGECPIIGEDIQFAEPIDGRVDILAQSRSDKEVRRYRLTDGIYRLVKP
jgi:hypothetical protein